MDDGFNDRLDEVHAGGSNQAFRHANLVGNAIEFCFLLPIRHAHPPRKQGQLCSTSRFCSEPSATLPHLTGANLLIFMRSSRMTTVTIYRPATTHQGALDG